MANGEAWAQGVQVAEKNMDQVHKMTQPGNGMMGSKKHGGKIKKTGRYKLHKGEKVKVGKRTVRKVKHTGPYRAIRGEDIVTAENVKKDARKRVARKRA